MFSCQEFFWANPLPSSLPQDCDKWKRMEAEMMTTNTKMLKSLVNLSMSVQDIIILQFCVVLEWLLTKKKLLGNALMLSSDLWRFVHEKSPLVLPRYSENLANHRQSEQNAKATTRSHLSFEWP